MELSNKRILITAGPTWVAIDKVRVISNTATGETGILLANRLQRLGARVTLLMGPAGACCLNNGIRLIHFRFFGELRALIRRELKSVKYDAVIHSAAVSDYAPESSCSRKVKSGIKRWSINLVPTPKIINSLKGRGQKIFLIGFKFEPGADKRRLTAQARRLLGRSGSDLVVANSIDNGNYSAYIISPDRVSGLMRSRNALAAALTRKIGEAFSNY